MVSDTSQISPDLNKSNKNHKANSLKRPRESFSDSKNDKTSVSSKDNENSLESSRKELSPCFCHESKASFVSYVQSNPHNTRFDRAKYAQYCSFLTEGRSIAKKLPKKEKVKYLAKSTSVEKTFFVIDGKLYYNRIEGPVPVIVIDKIVDTVEKVHVSMNHPVIRKTFEALKEIAYGIVLGDISWLMKRCVKCILMLDNETAPPLRVTEAKHTMERVQMGVIDFVKMASNGYRWALLLKDHFSKMTWLWPLKEKNPEAISKCLKQFFGYCGPPEMLQCGNGKEFKGEVERLIKERRIKLIAGGASHFSSSGLVASASRAVRWKVTCWLLERNRTDWENCLDAIMYAMNVCPCDGIPRDLTPHEIMFGVRRPAFYDRLGLAFF